MWMVVFIFFMWEGYCVMFVIGFECLVVDLLLVVMKVGEVVDIDYLEIEWCFVIDCLLCQYLVGIVI